MFNLERSDSSSYGRGASAPPLQGFKEVEKFIGKQTGTSTWVVQKYLEDPMLIHGCKFDIRQLILITHEREVWRFVGCRC